VAGLALIGSAEESCLTVESVQQVNQPQRSHPARRELEGQGQPINGPGDLGEVSASLRCGIERDACGLDPLGEQIYCAGLDSERVQAPDPLTGYGERFARRHQQTDLAALIQHPDGEFPHGLQHVLGVVQDDQASTRPKRSDK